MHLQLKSRDVFWIQSCVLSCNKVSSQIWCQYFTLKYLMIVLTNAHYSHNLLYWSKSILFRFVCYGMGAYEKLLSEVVMRKRFEKTGGTYCCLQMTEWGSKLILYWRGQAYLILGKALLLKRYITLWISTWITNTSRKLALLKEGRHFERYLLWLKVWHLQKEIPAFIPESKMHPLHVGHKA